MYSNLLHRSTRASILTLNRDVPMTTICLYGCLSLLTKPWGSVFKCSRRGMVKNYRTKGHVVLPAQGRVLSCVLKNEEFTRQWKQWWWALLGRVGLRSGHHEGISSRKSPTKRKVQWASYPELAVDQMDFNLFSRIKAIRFFSLLLAFSHHMKMPLLNRHHKLSAHEDSLVGVGPPDSCLTSLWP